MKGPICALTFPIANHNNTKTQKTRMTALFTFHLTIRDT